MGTTEFGPRPPSLNRDTILECIDDSVGGSQPERLALRISMGDRRTLEDSCARREAPADHLIRLARSKSWWFHEEHIKPDAIELYARAVRREWRACLWNLIRERWSTAPWSRDSLVGVPPGKPATAEEAVERLVIRMVRAECDAAVSSFRKSLGLFPEDERREMRKLADAIEALSVLSEDENLVLRYWDDRSAWTILDDSRGAVPSINAPRMYPLMLQTASGPEPRD